MGLFKRKYKPVFITTKSAFTITLIVIVLTIFIVWLQGLHLERSVVKNSLLSTVILSVFLFLFMFIGLYRGYKLKDNLGEITDTFKLDKDSGILDWSPTIDVDINLGDGLEEFFISIVLWILATIVIGILLFIFGTMVWFSILLLLAILYWIFFRGLRLVFKKSPVCQRNLVLSLRYAFTYTTLSTLWLVILLFITEHQNNTLVAFGALFS